MSDPTITAANMATLIETVGWDTLIAVADGVFRVEHADGHPVGLRIELAKPWAVMVINTDQGVSVGRVRLMADDGRPVRFGTNPDSSFIPHGWVHGVTGGLPTAVMRCAVVSAPWPPTEEEP